MVSLVIFDLDGVLVSARNVHFIAFTRSLSRISGLELSLERHTQEFNRLTTRQKINKLIFNGEVDKDHEDKIWNMKQDLTIEYMKDMRCDSDMISFLFTLKKDGYKIACCSNSISSTVLNVLRNSGVGDLFDIVLSNDNIMRPKPNPEIYLRCMATLGISPMNTVIIEDNIIGVQSAFYSGAHVIAIPNPQINTDYIMKKIKSIKPVEFRPLWTDPINVIIPAAGLGSRFSGVYPEPKPFIPVNGKPMVELVEDNLEVDPTQVTLIFNKQHNYKKYLSLFT